MGVHLLKRTVSYLLNRRGAKWVKRNWSHAADHETEFWDDWIGTAGGEKYGHAFAKQLDPNLPLQDDIVELLGKPEGSDVVIVDVGAGPSTVLGKVYPGRNLKLYPVDPLADHYNALWEKHGHMVPVKTIKCKGEELRTMFEDDFADLVFSRNAIDHAFDPVKIIHGMIAICKPDGAVCVRVEENEGQNENYEGMHQWNFGRENGELILWRPGLKVDLGKILSKCGTLSVKAEDGWIEFIVRPHDKSTFNFPDDIALVSRASLVKYSGDLKQ